MPVPRAQTLGLAPPRAPVSVSDDSDSDGIEEQSDEEPEADKWSTPSEEPASRVQWPEQASLLSCVLFGGLSPARGALRLGSESAQQQSGLPLQLA